MVGSTFQCFPPSNNPIVHLPESTTADSQSETHWGHTGKEVPGGRVVLVIGSGNDVDTGPYLEGWGSGPQETKGLLGVSGRVGPRFVSPWRGRVHPERPSPVG